MRFSFIALSLIGCANVDKANESLQKYAASMYPGFDVQYASCEPYDSDGNGRVRCNLSVARGDEIHVSDVECPSGWLWQPMTTQCVGIKPGSRW